MVKLTHIAGTFLIKAEGSFLNGAGLVNREDKNMSGVKTFADNVNGKWAECPYVSSQAFRRWLRDTMIQETGWPASTLRALSVNQKGNTNKLGGALDPVMYAEDDLFGLMQTEKGSGKTKKVKKTTQDGTTQEVKEVAVEEEDDEPEEEAQQKGEKIRALTRTSPLSTSILMSLRSKNWRGVDDAWVHLIDSTPNPYSTEFMNTNLQGIFCLNYARVAKFVVMGDRVELNREMIYRYITSGDIVRSTETGQQYYSLEKQGNVMLQVAKNAEVYELKDAVEKRKERASALINALSVLRGGSKQAAYATDVSPKVLLMAGLSSGNLPFNNLFEDEGRTESDSRSVTLNIDTLNEIVDDYEDRLVTPVIIGIRNGYLKNQDEIKDQLGNNNKYIVTTPVKAAKQLTDIIHLQL